MSSLTKQNSKGRKGWRLRFYQNKKRRSLWIGDVPKRIADGIAYNIDSLVQAHAVGQSPDIKASQWANSLQGRLRQTLASWGLVDAMNITPEISPKLEQFLADYIQGRTDVSESTRSKYQQTQRFLVEYFGPDRLVASITASDAKKWKRWFDQYKLKSPVRTIAKATVSKHVKRAKTLFQEAVDARLIDENPMEGLKAGSEVNRSRDHFIDRPTAYKVLEGCPDPVWRLIFALARFGGLRRCEFLSIAWGDILWDEGKLRIDSPKTGLRFCPIFPELLPYLEQAFDDAVPGEVRCIARYSKIANLGTQMNRIIEKCGLNSWEKTFQNLRASRRTELEEQFPNHVVNAWIGHSAKVAEKSYLQVTPDHWKAGAAVSPDQNGGPTGGPISANQGLSSGTTHGTTDTQLHEKTHSRRDLEWVSAPPTDAQRNFFLHGKIRVETA